MVGQQKEAKLVNRWLAKFHRTAPQWTRIRLGQVANNEEAKFHMVKLRWADAIFIEDGKVHIVEGKLRPELGVFGQLEGYSELFRVTPEFMQWWNWPIELIILTPVLDLNLVEIAKKKGIKYEIFKEEEWE